ncbi:MAG: cytidine deaminase [Flavobacteriales bacterium]|nr:cytidine deaminase [Flavobacteriales bacterium]
MQPTKSLPNEIRSAAIRVAELAYASAYAPYSSFAVGACIVDSEGGLHSGCNVENASYGLTICAERVAIGNAISSGRRGFVCCVIVTDTAKPVAPCGACRQVLIEHSDSLVVISRTLTGLEKQWYLSDLLVDSFSKSDL